MWNIGTWNERCTVPSEHRPHNRMVTEARPLVRALFDLVGSLYHQRHHLKCLWRG